MADQLQEIVARMMAAGESEENIAAVIRSFPTEPVPSHGDPQEARPISTGGGRGTGLDVRKSDAWARDNAPAIGATLATTAGPAGLIPAIGMAMLGGGAGSLARGDEPDQALTEGATQGAIQLGGGLAVKGVRGIARGLMNGTVPKPIAKEYPDINIGKEMVERDVYPGFKASQNSVNAQSAAANAERDAAAETVPVMSRRKVIEGIRPIHQKAKTGKVTKMSDEAMEYMKETFREVGADGLTGPAALARKDVKQLQGSAALNSGSSAGLPGLANAERAAIVSHLRETPRMERGLNESQIWKAISEVMADNAPSNLVTRGRIGGLPAMALSPTGVGVTAHAVNKAAPALSPDMLRAALMALMSDRSNRQ